VQPKTISLEVVVLSRGSKQEMPYCPECGGEMQYIALNKRYACKSCGLSVTHQELIEMREQLRPKTETESEERKKTQKEYLKWWLGKKK
jgi:tRNA(Ile2) C34 agmatinyltransferase TiaS